MSKTALITGVMGQDGSYLSELLIKKKYRVIGGYHNFENWRHKELKIEKQIKYVHLDITNYNNIKKILLKYKVNEIYNFAGQSEVKKSNLVPKKTYKVNLIGTYNILENIRKIRKKIKFYQANSSEMFGKYKGKIVNENSKFFPETPYAKSKLFAHYLVKKYRENFKIFACNGIAFNHESPLRSEKFVSKKIIKQIYEIFLNKRKFMKIGNILTKRDWGYAKEYVGAFWLIMQQNRPDDFIIATSKINNIKYFIEQTCNLLKIRILWKTYKKNLVGINIKNKKIIIQIDKKHYSKYDLRNYKADISKIRKIGWSPKTKLKDLIKIMIKHEKNLYKT
jgi:GDPmannose 4,6-dehydratase